MLTDIDSLRWRFGWFIQTGFRTLTLVWIELNGLKVWSISEGCPSSWQIKTLKVICSNISNSQSRLTITTRRLPAEDSPSFDMLCLDRKKKRLWQNSYDHYWWASVPSIKRLLMYYWLFFLFACGINQRVLAPQFPSCSERTPLTLAFSLGNRSHLYHYPTWHECGKCLTHF